MLPNGMIVNRPNQRVMMRPDGRCFVSNGPNVQSEFEEQPVSRTYQYRKVMKPLLERKRRARMNRCLDELKDLMLTSIQAEGENVSKLEKADILELTVQHLKKLKQQRSLDLLPESVYNGRFREGFTRCANEVSQYLASVAQHKNAVSPITSVDDNTGVKLLLQHLSTCIHKIEGATVLGENSSPYTTPPSSPSSSLGHSSAPLVLSPQQPAIWRPW